MGQLQEKYRRFRQWQQQPIHYVNSKSEHQCNNCGLTYTGNYCPCCSQKAGVGRIGWRSVQQSVMDIWGLGTRSLINTAWQLLSRPGYLISDYISGKRQICFPPVKMLFILAVAYALIFHWLFPNMELFGLAPDFKDFNKEVGDIMTKSAKPLYDWYETYFSWVMLGLSFVAIFPTWVMFRYAPRHTRHTLPEGFFIQILFIDLQLVVYFLILPCWFFFSQCLMLATSLIAMVYYIIGYRQLFGYSLWGVLWRQAFIFGFIYCVIVSVIYWFIDLSVLAEEAGMPPEQMLAFRIFFFSVFFIAGVLILAIGHIINLITTRKVRKELKRR